MGWNLRGLNRVWDDFTGNSAVDAQNQANIQLWKMQTEYNSPVNQMKRYREAGLNPNLVYGGSGQMAGNATNAPAMQAHQSDAAQFMNVLQNLYSLRNLKAQNKNLNAQTDSIKADTALKGKNVELRDKELGIKSRELDILERTGMRPGVSSALLGLGSEFANELTGDQKSPVERARGVGRAIRNAYDAGLPSVIDRTPDRATRMAVEVADKKGLTGSARAGFVRKFVEIYNKSH